MPEQLDRHARPHLEVMSNEIELNDGASDTATRHIVALMRSRSILAGLAALGSVIGADLRRRGCGQHLASRPPVPPVRTWRCPPRSDCSTLARPRPSRPVGTISVAVTGAAPLPAPGTVTAVVLNLTVTPPSGPGFWTVWPHASPRPEASNLNVDEIQSLAGNVTPNLVTVPVGVRRCGRHLRQRWRQRHRRPARLLHPGRSATSGRFEPLATPRHECSTPAGSRRSQPARPRRSPCPAPPAPAPSR